jgi:hypothetical protein
VPLCVGSRDETLPNYYKNNDLLLIGGEVEERTASVNIDTTLGRLRPYNTRPEISGYLLFLWRGCVTVRDGFDLDLLYCTVEKERPPVVIP